MCNLSVQTCYKTAGFLIIAQVQDILFTVLTPLKPIRQKHVTVTFKLPFLSVCTNVVYPKRNIKTKQS